MVSQTQLFLIILDAITAEATTRATDAQQQKLEETTADGLSKHSYF
jgi:hypothetical protein